MNKNQFSIENLVKTNQNIYLEAKIKEKTMKNMKVKAE